MPTSEQIAQILWPWRTESQREIASRLVDLRGGYILWLRTNYDDDLEARHEEFLESFDIGMVVDYDDFILDDSADYNFNDQWEKVLHVLPEIVSSRPDNFSSDRLKHALVELNAFRRGGVDQAPQSLLQYLTTFSRDELQETLGQILLSNFHERCVATCLIVEDRQALESGEILLLFLDFEGNVVRKSRIDMTETPQVSGAWARPCWDESTEWEEAEISEQYQREERDTSFDFRR